MLRKPLVAGLALMLLACTREERSPFLTAMEACHDSELSCPRPIFNVHSLKDSQRYYRDKLGFKIDWEHGSPPDFGSVSRGHGVIFLCQDCQGKPGAWAMIFAPKVDELYEEFRGKGALVRQPPRNMPWKLREMHVSDPDGNVLRLAGPLEH